MTIPRPEEAAHNLGTLAFSGLAFGGSNKRDNIEILLITHEVNMGILMSKKNPILH
jgi:hypothetical protein